MCVGQELWGGLHEGELHVGVAVGGSCMWGLCGGELWGEWELRG